MQVPYDEGVAIRIGPESCAGSREAVREALTGVCIGQPLSGERTSQPECRCLPVGRRQHGSVRYASADRLRAVCRPWHVHTSSIREPRGLPFAARQPGVWPHSEGRGS